ncbi:NAD(P)/FAD-dependent oxidoreductase [Amnibacterium sp. CER49]|uniref:NAD(P)/FAD-dependent oxidoreductase n=1 Tax=Amnibacterium sp. CER49 TaxID=3039161 RepID=UPI00244BDE9F|nr:NAD(P)/FAD-dependent oxidoreductase [Amnibacterium sp. CER49]MDH2443557.1 NAD(P)/FAD-dependent oxidoreductase [Amnibacterium sp. CER49]
MQDRGRGAEWDALVLGGGGAGLGAALTLARARRRVLVVDGGEPRNASAAHSHGVLGFDGSPPSVLLERGRAEVARYDGVLRRGEARAVERMDDGFLVAFADGGTTSARQLLVATGVRDELPDVPGLAEQWGRGAVVCPYCDGWESRDARIALLATDEGGVSRALLLRQWSTRVVLLTHDAFEPSRAHRRALEARGVEVLPGRVEQVLSLGDRLTGVRVAGERRTVDRVFVTPRAVPNDALLRMLGAATTERGAGVFVEVSRAGATSVPGLWAAGNVVDPSLKVATAVGDGTEAGAAMNEALVALDTEAALADALARTG